MTDIPPSTVYRILKNPHKAKPELLQKIHEVSNIDLAKILLKKVHIVIPFLNAFYTQFLFHCIEFLQEKDIQVTSHIYNENPEKEDKILSSLVISPSIGLLWAPHGTNYSYPFLKRKKSQIPVVTLFRQIEKSDVQVLQDNEAAIKTILQNIALQNKKKVLFLNGASNLFTAKQRYIFFEQYIKQYPNMSGQIFSVDFDNWKSVYEYLLANTKQIEDCDSIIASSEHICLAVIRYIKDTKAIEYLSKIKVFSFDYSPTFEILDFSMVYFCPKQAASKTVEILLQKTTNPDLGLNYYLPPSVFI